MAAGVEEGVGAKLTEEEEEVDVDGCLRGRPGPRFRDGGGAWKEAPSSD